MFEFEDDDSQSYNFQCGFEFCYVGAADAVDLGAAFVAKEEVGCCFVVFAWGRVWLVSLFFPL